MSYLEDGPRNHLENQSSDKHDFGGNESSNRRRAPCSRIASQRATETSKLKVKNINTIYEINFEVAQTLEKNKGQGATPPRWSAVERSPEARAAKRVRAAAAAAVRSTKNGTSFIEVDEAGTVWYKAGDREVQRKGNAVEQCVVVELDPRRPQLGLGRSEEYVGEGPCQESWEAELEWECAGEGQFMVKFWPHGKGSECCRCRTVCAPTKMQKRRI